MRRLLQRDSVLEHLEVVIESYLLHQIFMSPLLNYASPVDNNDLIRSSDRGETVSDYDARPVRHDRPDGLLDQHFRF